MGDLFDTFHKVEVNNKNETIEELYEIQKAYLRLLREYKEEFEFVQNSLKELREERCNFYNVELPKMKAVLESDKVADDTQKIWMEELQGNMEKSFLISERLSNDLLVKKMDEFKQEAERILKEGR